MPGGHRDLMDGEIQVGDVVVSRVNGTFDFYSIATVLSAIGDLTLRGISTIEGEDAALMRACELQKDGRAVWLFPGPPRDEGTRRADFLIRTVHETRRALTDASAADRGRHRVIGDCRGAATAPYRRVPASRRVPPAAAQTRLSNHAPAHLRSSRNQRNH
jgi:hypothetical protein